MALMVARKTSSWKLRCHLNAIIYCLIYYYCRQDGPVYFGIPTRYSIMARYVLIINFFLPSFFSPFSFPLFPSFRLSSCSVVITTGVKTARDGKFYGNRLTLSNRVEKKSMRIRVSNSVYPSRPDELDIKSIKVRSYSEYFVAEYFCLPGSHDLCTETQAEIMIQKGSWKTRKIGS